jgi:DNA-directed RNA polymerase specialized sigma24 family protein
MDEDLDLRITVLLRIQEGKKFEEIAAIMECSVGAAKANYHHAVQKLKAKLEEKPRGENAPSMTTDAQ